jgi:hypothetical protein
MVFASVNPVERVERSFMAVRDCRLGRIDEAVQRSELRPLDGPRRAGLRRVKVTSPRLMAARKTAPTMRTMVLMVRGAYSCRRKPSRSFSIAATVILSRRKGANLRNDVPIRACAYVGYAGGPAVGLGFEPKLGGLGKGRELFEF